MEKKPKAEMKPSERIEWFGWTRCNIENAQGERCIIGSLHPAPLEFPEETRYDGVLSYARETYGSEVIDALIADCRDRYLAYPDRTWLVDDDFEALYLFNDFNNHTGIRTTKEDVLSALRKVGL